MIGKRTLGGSGVGGGVDGRVGGSPGTFGTKGSSGSRPPVMPPPFPLEPFVAAAAFFEYPRRRLFAVIGATRLARYVAEGGLAVHHSERVLAFFRSASVERALIGLFVASVLTATVCAWRCMLRC